MSETRAYRFGLGSFDCAVFNDFTNPQPLSGLVSGVPEARVRQALRELGLPPEPALLDTNVLAIWMGETLALIDSGWGAQGSLHRLLHAEGIARTEIDMVIITHTDGDHVGGLLDEDKSLAFPNAEHVMTRRAWDRWMSDDYLRQLTDDQAEWVQSLTAMMEANTRRLEVDVEIVPGARLVDASGHRAGHVAVGISSDGEEMLHVADAVLSPIFIQHPGWHSPIDSHPAQAAQTRQALLSRAAEGNLLVASAHLPFPGLGRVEAQAGDWLWQPLA